MAARWPPAGAGAAGAVYLTDNGAEARIEASVDETYQAAQQAFEEMKIVRTGTSQEDNGKSRRELEGKAGDRDVNITIEQDGSMTKVEVTAKTSAVTWDKDYARSVLEEILENTK